MYLLTKYIKSVLWRSAERLSYIEDAWYLKVKDYGFLGAFAKLRKAIIIFFKSVRLSGSHWTDFHEI